MYTCIYIYMSHADISHFYQNLGEIYPYSKLYIILLNANYEKISK